MRRDADAGGFRREAAGVEQAGIGGRRQQVDAAMMLGVTLSELAWLALAIVAGGVITGLLAGLFGIGGGAVIVPVLYEVFRVLDVPDTVRMQLCVGTSLAIIVPTTIQNSTGEAITPTTRLFCR